MILNEEEKTKYIELLKQQYESTSKTLKETERLNKEIRECIDNLENTEGEAEIKTTPFIGFNGGNDTWGIWGLLAVASLFGLGDKNTKSGYITDIKDDKNPD